MNNLIVMTRGDTHILSATDTFGAYIWTRVRAADLFVETKTLTRDEAVEMLDTLRRLVDKGEGVRLSD